MAGDAEQVLNRLDQMPPEGFQGPGVAIGPFTLPPPAPLTDREKDEYSKTAVTRVFDTLAEMDRDVRQKGVKKQEVVKGFNRPAAPMHDRDGWLSLVTRLATRSQFDLQDGDEEPVKQENGDRTLAKKGSNFSLSTGIRESLLNYVMENFRARITVAINWLNEEWYCDRILQKQKGAEGPTETTPTYNSYTIRLLDSMIPYLDTKDNKVLIRLVSEIPHLPAELFPKIRKIADDPERVNLVVQALLYLVMFRPPVRELALDALEALWRENEDARKPAERHLARWRPEVVEKGIDGAGEVKAEA
jgi:symplekin